MQEQEGVERLVLGGGREGAFRREIRQVVSNVLFFQVTRMREVVVFHVPDDPASIGLFGAVAVALSLAEGPDAVEEGGGAVRRRVRHDESSSGVGLEPEFDPRGVRLYSNDQFSFSS